MTTFFPENITKSGEPVVARAIATDMNGISSTDLYLQPGGKRKSIKLNMSAYKDYEPIHHASASGNIMEIRRL